MCRGPCPEHVPERDSACSSATRVKGQLKERARAASHDAIPHAVPHESRPRMHTRDRRQHLSARCFFHHDIDHGRRRGRQASFEFQVTSTRDVNQMVSHHHTSAAGCRIATTINLATAHTNCWVAGLAVVVSRTSMRLFALAASEDRQISRRRPEGGHLTPIRRVASPIG